MTDFTKRTRLQILSVFIAGILAAPATSASAQSEIPTEGEAVWQYLNQLPRTERMAILEREAKREGGFVIYGATGIDKANEFLDLFHDKYPDVKAEFVRLQAAELVDRLMIEQSTGRVNADIAVSNVDWLAVLNPALAPYQPTRWDEFDERFVWGSVENGWTAIVYELMPTTIVWRTDRVSADEAPRTLDEVMDPKWRGRTGATTLLERFIDALAQKYGEEPAMKKAERLADLDNRLYRSTAALAQGIASGEIDIAWNFNADRPARLKAAGAPIDFVLQDPLHGSGVTMSVVRGAQNPYGAALFMEFMMDPKTIEQLDKLSGMRVYGSLEADVSLPISDLPDLILFRPMSEERISELNRVAEELFIRR